MFSLILRGCRANAFGGTLNDRIISAKDNRNLLDIYNESKLDSEQKVLLLNSIVGNLISMSQVLSLFKTALGQRYMKDTMREFRTYNPEHQALILYILSSTTGKNRKNVVTIEEEKQLVSSISKSIDPDRFPQSCIKAYLNSAKIMRMNFALEKKVLYILENNPNLTIADLHRAINGALLTLRENSYKICEKALKVLKTTDYSNANPLNLVKLFAALNEMNLIFNIEEDAQNVVSDKIISIKDQLDMACVHTIIQQYTKNQYLPKALLLTALEVIVERSEDMTFFWGDQLENSILALEVLRRNKYELDLKDEFFLILTDLTMKMNLCGKTKNSESFIMFSTLLSYSSKITEFTSNHLMGKFTEPGQNLFTKLSISALFSRLDNEKMKNELVNLCKLACSDTSFSLASYINMYQILHPVYVQHEFVEVKRLMQIIENSFSSVIVDIGSYMEFTTILLKSEEFVKKTPLWDRVGQSAVQVLADVYKARARPVAFILGQLLKFYSRPSNSYLKWVELTKSILKDISGKEVTDTFYWNFNQSQLEGLVELLVHNPNQQYFAFAHCLSVQIRQPSYNLLENVTSLFKRYGIDVYKEKKFRLSESSLFYHIFRKGFSSKIHSFLNYQSYLKCITGENSPHVVNLMNLSAQYGHLSSDQVKILKKMKVKEIENNPNNLVALATVDFSVLKKPEEVFEKFFNIEQNSLVEVVGKFNLYIKIKQDVEGQGKFIEDVEAIIEDASDEHPLQLLEFIQSISKNVVYEKKEDYTRVLYHCIETLMDKELHRFSIDDLAYVLIALIEKDYSKEEYIEILENLIDNKLRNEDIIEYLLRLYIKNNRLNSFFNKNFVVAMNHLSESTFNELVELKNNTN